MEELLKMIAKEIMLSVADEMEDYIVYDDEDEIRYKENEVSNLISNK